MNRRFVLRRFAAIALAAALIFPLAAIPAAAQSLGELKAQGIVGERPDGLLGVVAAGAGASARAFVAEVNDQRMANYRQIAEDTRAPLDAVQARAGAQLIAATPPGQYIMSAAGQWMKK
jgi:uncharacterized protein YdbL (DUF1318 family)